MLFRNAVKPGTLILRFSTIDSICRRFRTYEKYLNTNVVGLTVKEARGVIARSMFEVGLVERKEDDKDESDIIYYQDPASGDIGIRVCRWISGRVRKLRLN